MRNKKQFVHSTLHLYLHRQSSACSAASVFVYAHRFSCTGSVARLFRQRSVYFWRPVYFQSRAADWRPCASVSIPFKYLNLLVNSNSVTCCTFLYSNHQSQLQFQSKSPLCKTLKAFDIIKLILTNYSVQFWMFFALSWFKAYLTERTVQNKKVSYHQQRGATGLYSWSIIIYSVWL